MVQKPQALALVPTLIILCLMLENSSASLCSRTFEVSLYQTKQLIMHINDRTKQLYKSYLTHHDLHLRAPQFCQQNLSWFPKKDITKKTGSMLRRLHKTLEYMNYSLRVIREQQRDLNYEDASIHEELKAAQKALQGLLHNTKCSLRLRGQTPISIPPPTRPSDLNSFDVKIEGCQVLWNYSQFIGHLSQAFKSRQPEEEGSSSQKRDAEEQKHPAAL